MPGISAKSSITSRLIPEFVTLLPSFLREEPFEAGTHFALDLLPPSPRRPSPVMPRLWRPLSMTLTRRFAASRPEFSSRLEWGSLVSELTVCDPTHRNSGLRFRQGSVVRDLGRPLRRRKRDAYDRRRITWSQPRHYSRLPGRINQPPPLLPESCSATDRIALSDNVLR